MLPLPASGARKKGGPSLEFGRPDLARDYKCTRRSALGQELPRPGLVKGCKGSAGVASDRGQPPHISCPHRFDAIDFGTSLRPGHIPGRPRSLFFCVPAFPREWPKSAGAPGKTFPFLPSPPKSLSKCRGQFHFARMPSYCPLRIRLGAWDSLIGPHFMLSKPCDGHSIVLEPGIGRHSRSRSGIVYPL